VSQATTDIFARGDALNLARKAVATQTHIERRASLDHLRMLKALMGELSVGFGLAETCHRAADDLSCVERGCDVERYCPSCVALHHACGFEEAVGRLMLMSGRGK
jgi:hypothetical protein